ncbi:uncharacterized protein [Choristoneura fumiferana]|uniref:uncharacterized protein n=1 Tax=Choristoneura fumiferana TaxID=7141 RepID=UPI003D15E75E
MEGLGPYINGLGKRKAVEVESASKVNEKILNFFSNFDENVGKRRKTTHLDAELVPKFDPGPKSLCVKVWLNKIDQLGRIHNWGDADKSYVMHMRLRGSAREWYENLDNYELSWDDWKNALERAFPIASDFVDKLELMLSRKKTESETMTTYYHDKLSLIKKCRLDEEGATSCIIRGLPQELRANAKAFRCESAEELYYGYLSSLENYKRVESGAVKNKETSRGTWRRPSGLPSVKLCYVCRKPGHEGKDCRSLLHCNNCQRRGHDATTCWLPIKLENSNHATRELRPAITATTSAAGMGGWRSSGGVAAGAGALNTAAAPGADTSKDRRGTRL